MASVSPVHWIVGLLALALYLIPAVKIIRKAGYSGWWCLLLLIPGVNLIAYWVFAFAKWPALRGASAA